MGKPVLRTLMYHRVLDADAAARANPSLVSADPAGFDEQMRHLARNYRVVSADEVFAAQYEGRPLPPRAVLLTFDDAYRDFGEVAWPILRKYRLPATVFVSTEFAGRPERCFWWDRLFHAIHHARVRSLTVPSIGTLRLGDGASRAASLRRMQQCVKQLPHHAAMALVDDLCARLGPCPDPVGSVLGWPELRELARDGVTIGGHTRTHPALDRLPREALDGEIRGGRRDIELELGIVPFVFAYPFGAHDIRSVGTVRRAGFGLAFTCRDGHGAVPSADPLRLPRTNITPRTTSWLFRLRLHRLGAYVDRLRNSHARRRHAALT